LTEEQSRRFNSSGMEVRVIVGGVLASLLLSVPLDIAAAAEPPACTSGIFAVMRRPLVRSRSFEPPDLVTLAAGTVAIASGCPAVPANIRVTPKGTRVRATWAECGGARRVRLRARIRPNCGAMTGRLVVERPAMRRRFVAPPCGDEDCRHPVCATNTDCHASAFCQKALGACHERGTCQTRPRACPVNIDRVCGCDGETYSNACFAWGHGVSVAHAGSCQQVCAGIAGLPCPEGQVCNLPAGECHIVDGQGTCVERPDACLQIYNPVCGCDGMTYGNDCDLVAAGAQKDHDGPCRVGE
jgi:hypothetical protein